MKSIIVLLSICVATLWALSPAEKAQQQKEQEHRLLQTYLESAQDSLQILITRQYTFKQQAVEQREADKGELDKLREQQERLENDLARIKEQRLVREQSLEEERKNLTLKQEEIASQRSQLKDQFQKEADALVEAFPLDLERRRIELESVRKLLAVNADAAGAMNAFVAYRLHWFAMADSISLTKGTIMPLDEGPKSLTVARFGSLAAYGIDTAGQSYYIRQTGRLGSERYAVERIAAPEIAARIAALFPQWLGQSAITGTVPLEILQNDQARLLIAGKKESYWVEFYHSLEKGGMVMIPMFLLGGWAIVLSLLKTAQYAKYSAALKKQSALAAAMIEKKEYDQAVVWLQQQKSGLVARIVNSCLSRRTQGRAVNERSVHEIMSLEIPLLSRSLNTLAVIAGAAPLMGLLGTISGMITLFAAVTHYGTGDPKFLAGGISEALITAKTGLAIAIPVLLIHDLLRSAKDRLVASMEQQAILALNEIFPGE